MARRPALIVIAIALGLLGPLALYAAAQEDTELGGKIRSGNTVVVAAGETVTGDLYAFGNVIQINGRVDGDLIAMGGQVEIAGTVTGDAIVGAGTVLVTGDVGGDVRAGAGQVSIAGKVGEDLFVGSGQLAVSTRATVGEDLVFGSGRVNIDGPVGGDILGGAGTYSRTGTLGGTETVELDEQPVETAPTALDRSLDALSQFAAVFVIAALAMWLMPRAFYAAEAAIRTRPGASAVSGLIAIALFIGAIIAIVIGAVLIAIVAGAIGLGALAGLDIVIGLLLVATLVVSFIVASFLAPALVGLALARVVGRTTTSSSRLTDLAYLAAFTAAVVVATVPPVIGPLVNIVVTLLGLGALFVVAREWWKGRTTAPLITPTG